MSRLAAGFSVRLLHSLFPRSGSRSSSLASAEVCDRCCVFVSEITQTRPSQIPRHTVERWSEMRGGTHRICRRFIMWQRERERLCVVAGLLLPGCSPCWSLCFSGGQCHPGASSGFLPVSRHPAFTFLWLHSQQVQPETDAVPQPDRGQRIHTRYSEASLHL